ncbi:hypothetical protein [Streptomyces mirabilis]|uniref:hypothetical protein n=1 Tax=Streptomyces mirabilis TaxID=68239 RepID=UPI0036821C55
MWGKPVGFWVENYRLPEEWECWNCEAVNITPDGPWTPAASVRRPKGVSKSPEDSWAMSGHAGHPRAGRRRKCLFLIRACQELLGG